MPRSQWGCQGCCRLAWEIQNDMIYDDVYVEYDVDKKCSIWESNPVPSAG